MNTIKVKSFTDSETEYTIYNTEDGYKCTCPDFALRQHKCKHIKRYQHLRYKK